MKSDKSKKVPSKAAKPPQPRAAAAAKPASSPGRPAAPKPEAPKTPVPKIPPFLLEGDATPPAPASGPGQRYALGPAPSATPSARGPELTALPEAYGTQRLLLTARDPHWLYAHWDLTSEQLKKYNARSVDRHLVLRIYKDQPGGEPYREIHVHPESRNWFAHVGLGGAKFQAELGYYRPSDQWVGISSSPATLTPPDSMSDDLSVWFQSLPAEVQFDKLIALVKSALKDNLPLLEAVEQLRRTGVRGLPALPSVITSQWTPAQEAALAQVVSMDAVRRVWIGSLEITELIRRQWHHEQSSEAAASLLPSAGNAVAAAISSPPGGMGAPGRKPFWFSVNAELILYGATEPGAEVTIGGRPIQLRPDGTFSYRFALPDGEYQLPATATAADGQSRGVELKFTRQTQTHGEVAAHPQDARLKPPLPAHVA